ncbi:tryptophan synthase subunit alpha [Streptomyces sp. NBC_01724]|uniref:tryptophan synthase subunit alpha n=1 Tax=Streptomyces sp. NBC_01724 TaxID=2975922 RepID=UPI002E3725BC|nr:tryptophan synthase subunit alpha [Streptomyces sp. NBC_01724]
MNTVADPQHARTGSGLGAAFATARAEGRAALAAYWPVGYPAFDQSMNALHAISASADILELGVPFSDPMLDGPVIQRATAQALANGFRMRHLFAAIRELAASCSAALLVMTYWQPVARFGPERFAAELACAGAAGVVLPDLPLEETGPWLAAARSRGLHTVLVAAPASTDARLARVCAAASGMIYAPAMAGVTGTQGPLASGLPSFIERLRAVTDLPVGVGFGVSTADQAAIVSTFADAVIVGSALIRQLNTSPGPAGIAAAAALARELADGVRCRLRCTTSPPVPSALSSGASRVPTHPTTAEESAMTIHHPRGRTAPVPNHPATATSQVSSIVTTLPAKDQALCAFLRKRIAEADAYGSPAEQKALAGAGKVLTEFEEKHPQVPHLAHDDFFVAQIDTLRWVLRCIAAGAFSAHPEFQPAFLPSSPEPAHSLEAQS